MCNNAGIKQNAPTKRECVFGADNRIRTGDLVLTKDVLCLLSHISIFVSHRNSFYIIAKEKPFVNTFFEFFCFPRGRREKHCQNRTNVV